MSDISAVETIFVFLQAVILLLLGIGIKRLGAMTVQMMKINGKVGKLDTWTEQHEKTDDERFEIIRDYQRERAKYVQDFRDDINREVSKLRDKLGAG